MEEKTSKVKHERNNIEQDCNIVLSPVIRKVMKYQGHFLVAGL